MRIPVLLSVVLRWYRVKISFHYTRLPRPPALHGTPRPGPVAQGLMGPQLVVEQEVVFQPPLGLQDVGVGFQVHLFVLHRPPQSLHEDVVGVPTLPVHADLHTSVLEDLGELQAGELAPLVGIEHLRLVHTQSLLQSPGAKAGVESVGQSPGHHVPAVPVHYRHQIEEPSGHGQVGDIRRPHPRLRGGRLWLGWVILTFLSR